MYLDDCPDHCWSFKNLSIAICPSSLSCSKWRVRRRRKYRHSLGYSENSDNSDYFDKFDRFDELKTLTTLKTLTDLTMVIAMDTIIDFCTLCNDQEKILMLGLLSRLVQ